MASLVSCLVGVKIENPIDLVLDSADCVCEGGGEGDQLFVWRTRD